MEEREAKPRVSIGEFMRQVQAEARKVYWPTRQETVTTSIFVAIMMLILAVFFLGIDTIFGSVMRWLLSLA
jgi:preprotein translocase subunit SecE